MEMSDYDLLVAATAKDAERRIHQVMFLEGEIKTLIEAIRAAKDKKSLCLVADQTVERINQHKHKEEQRRLTAGFSGNKQKTYQDLTKDVV
jgi:hypothetical protein